MIIVADLVQPESHSFFWKEYEVTLQKNEIWEYLVLGRYSFWEDKIPESENYTFQQAKLIITSKIMNFK